MSMLNRWGVPFFGWLADRFNGVDYFEGDFG